MFDLVLTGGYLDPCFQPLLKKALKFQCFLDTNHPAMKSFPKGERR